MASIMRSPLIGLILALRWEHLENRAASILFLNPQKLQHIAQYVAQSGMIDNDLGQDLGEVFIFVFFYLSLTL